MNLRRRHCFLPWSALLVMMVLLVLFLRYGQRQQARDGGRTAYVPGPFGPVAVGIPSEEDCARIQRAYSDRPCERKGER